MKRWLLGLVTVLLAATALVFSTGCTTVGALGSLGSLGYYAQAAGGHLAMVRAARPVADWVADPTTPAPLRERLLLTQQMRDFAVQELKLPDNSSYRRYADLQRPSVVYNVVAAPELGLTLKTWCFAFVGCVGYRGYFNREPAEELAATLRAEGWETNVYGVPAYSTLGRTDWLGGDPLLNTFIQWSEGDVARLLFHELSHQIAYADDDTMFNESFAVAVERIGGKLWLAQRGSPGSQAENIAGQARRKAFQALTLATRAHLAQIYASTSNESDEDKRGAKAEAMASFRAEYEALKTDSTSALFGFKGYDGWVQRANNASFAVQAAYDELVPAFEQLFERQDRDFQRFYAEVQTLARLPKNERRSRLQNPP